VPAVNPTSTTKLCLPCVTRKGDPSSLWLVPYLFSDPAALLPDVDEFMLLILYSSFYSLLYLNHAISGVPTQR
jgi:hypothetical protein